MLIILFTIGIVLIILGCIGMYSRKWRIEFDFSVAMTVLGSCITAVVSLFMIIAITFSIKIPQMEERVVIYQEENARIEEQIKTAIEAYQDYEQEMFDKVDLDKITSEKLILLTSLYPELKADTMVQTQIQVYIDNTTALRELRIKKLDYELWRWWICFA